MPRLPSRRRFLQTATAVGGGLVAARGPHAGAAADVKKPLSIACIGMGGQMRGYLLPELAKVDQTVVAICDVDQRQLDAVRSNDRLTNAKAYRDYRELLEKEPQVDAVVIGTPDHWHVPICTAALNAGKHVYCEKPLAHSVAECHALEALARSRPQLATQTGNQGCSTEGFRRSVEVIRSGLLGDIKEVHVWHPAPGWPHAMNRPAESDPVPAGLDWDFWLGPAPARPYKEGLYHPAKWRGWYDFGGGSLADFCCHGFQLAYRALDLDPPTRIEATGDGLGYESFPTRCTVTFDFPAKAGRGPVRLFFYAGDKHVPPEEITKGPVGGTGCLVVGTAGTLSAGLWNTDCNVRLGKETAFQGANRPEIAAIAKSEPRLDTSSLAWDPKRAAAGERPRWSRVNNSHMFEWILACAGEGKTYSPFDIGARITEVGMLGMIALKLQKPIEWDTANRRVVGIPEAAALVSPQLRTEFLPRT